MSLVLLFQKPGGASYSLTAADSATAADLASRAFVGLRSASDSETASEASARVALLGRLTSDGGVFGRGGAAARAWAQRQRLSVDVGGFVTRLPRDNVQCKFIAGAVYEDPCTAEFAAKPKTISSGTLVWWVSWNALKKA